LPANKAHIETVLFPIYYILQIHLFSFTLYLILKNMIMKDLTLLVVGLFLVLNLTAQDEPKPFQFKFFPSIHFGFFTNNDAVNEFIAEDLSNYNIIKGTTDVIMSFNLGLGVGLRFANLVEVQPLLEYSLAPKVISGADKNYNFNKFSGGAIANFLIPLSANRKNSILVGAGIMYNSMSFDEFSASGINPRFQIGYSINNNRFNPQIILAADLAKGKDEKHENFELNYTSIRFGVNLNF